jgi:hypothetical protein
MLFNCLDVSPLNSEGIIHLNPDKLQVKPALALAGSRRKKLPPPNRNHAAEYDRKCKLGDNTQI